MEVTQVDDLIETEAQKRAKRLFLSIEPLPDKRLFRIDDRGNETYEDEQTPEDKLKFHAQLIHEPERPEEDKSRQTVERALGTSIDQFTRLKNLSAKLANPDSDFALSNVDPPPLHPEDQEKVIIAGFQSRQNQLKSSADLLKQAHARLKETVQHQRNFHEDFKTLSRSRWKMVTPDADWRPDEWQEHLNVFPKRFHNSFRPLEVFRSSDGTLTTLCPHNQTSATTLRVEAHDMAHSSATRYQATGIRGDIADLYRPLSNMYVAKNALDIHRIWIWITRSVEEYILWTSLKKAAVTEGFEVRDDELILQMPDRPVVFSVRTLKSKYIVPQSANPSTSSTSTAPNATTSNANAMDVDGAPNDDTSTSPNANPKKRKAPNFIMQKRLEEATCQKDTPTTFIDETSPFDDPSEASETDFDTALTQDLILLTLKQSQIIMQHAQLLETSKFPMFPIARRGFHPVVHPLISPSLQVAHQFRQLLEVSRMLDDLIYALPRVTGLGPISAHFEPTALATVSHLHVDFCTFHQIYTIKNGTFDIGSLQEVQTPIEFIQHLLQVLAAYIIKSIAQHSQALVGPDTATVHERKVVFPLGLSHPLRPSTTGKSSASKFADFFATFELPATSSLGLSPTLKIRPRIPGNPASALKLPLEQNVWAQLKGDNFIDRITSLLLDSW